MSNSSNKQSSKDLVVPYTFDRDDRIVIDDVECVHDNTTPMGYTFRRYDDGVTEHITHERVRELIRNGRMVIHPAYYQPGRAKIRDRDGARKFDDLTPMERKRVEFRKELCDRFLEREREDRSVSRSDQKMQPLLREIMVERNARHRACAPRGCRVGTQQNAPSPSTVRAWLRSYERADFDVMALADNYRRPA